MRCVRCQQDNPAGARFCNACGTSFEAACPTCGHPNAPGSRFCNECGQTLSALPAAHRFGSPRAYTPPHLAEKILSTRSALEGERKQVTVLFADLKSSLELLAERDPEEGRALLDPVLERMMEAVHLYEGTVNQILGDGIMALFGAPVAHEDHAVRACYAALRMQESVNAYGDEVQRLHGLPLQIRVGLNSGEVVVRSIGNDLHTDYMAVGQTTHLAARMEQMGKPGSVLVTADTFRLAEGSVQARSLGRVPVKGLEAPIEVYELTGAQSVRSRLQAAMAGGLSPFVGRELEMDQLGGSLEPARWGHGQVVAVVGEAGVGKTRLFFEFTRSPRTEGWLVLAASAVSYGKTTPYLPVIDLLRGYFHLEEREAPGSIQEKVTAKVLALDERLKDAIPPLLSLLDALPDDDAFRTLGPPQRRARTLEGLKRLFLSESRRQPLLLVIESLHWIDSETQACLDTLIESLPTARLLLLVSYRPEYQHGWGSKTYYTQLPMDPLAPPSASVLLQALIGGDPGLQPLKRQLIDRTEGNPFFLEESVRRLTEVGVLVGERGAYRLGKPLHTVKVPATVQAVLAARIDRLPFEEKRLLEAASVIGKDVPFALLGAIADLPETELRRGLMHLQAAEFLYETALFPELEYTFKHALTHDVAYGSLLNERRRGLHARIVEAIETVYPDRLADQVERLAHHALQGERWEKGLTYLRQAGAKAAVRSANSEAVTCFEQALAALKHLPERRETIEQAIDLRFELRPLLLQLGRLPEVLVRSQEAERMARDLGDESRLAHVYSYLINYHYLKGEPDRAIEYGQRCLTMRGPGQDLSLQALARRYMGHSYHAQGQYALAESILKENLAVLEAEGGGDAVADPISYVGSCAWLAFSLIELGDFDAAQTYVTRAQKVADPSQQAYSQAIAWTLAGLLWVRRGYFEAAVPPLERSLEACREKHLTVWQPIPSSLLGLTLTRLGRAADGLPLLEEGVKLSEEVGIRAYLALWSGQLAEGLFLAGQTEQAGIAAQGALDLALAHRERGHQAWALRLLGEIASHREPPATESAEAYYLQAVGLAQELQMRPLLALSDLGLSRLYRLMENRPKAEEHLTRATALLCDMDMRYWVREAWAELREIGELFIVGREHRALYDYLTQMLSVDERLLVLLDRRQEDRREDSGEQVPERRRTDRRRGAPPPHGLVIITPP
ncbi:MAG TPA: adenylate/guanylate cyclase domain-containing protein [Methylomirabilota bacterium]|nr:adenylate/guanylate cyclase domain-containing protein [Methylomirabilota bacterium]